MSKWTYYPPKRYDRGPALSHVSYYKVKIYGYNNPQTQAIGKTYFQIDRKSVV